MSTATVRYHIYQLQKLEIAQQVPWEVVKVGVSPRQSQGQERHVLGLWRSPGSELLLTVGLKQQTGFLFRLLLFHWCFPIDLSDQVIKYLNENKKKVLIRPTFETLFHNTIWVLLNITQIKHEPDKKT